MVNIRFTVTRFAPVLQAIERQLAPDGRLTCRLGAGRVYLVLRGAGASRWDPGVQLARALEMAATTRSMLAADPRSSVRTHASHAVVVRFEDVSVEQGCETRAHWECVVPRPAG